MTPEDARVVLEVLMTADGGCHVCAADLAGQFAARFPEHGDAAVEVYRAAFPDCQGHADHIAEAATRAKDGADHPERGDGWDEWEDGA
jgi:hypothetical protein